MNNNVQSEIKIRVQERRYTTLKSQILNPSRSYEDRNIRKTKEKNNKEEGREKDTETKKTHNSQYIKKCRFGRLARSYYKRRFCIVCTNEFAF